MRYLELQNSYLIDGLPGTGLVAKIAVEHIISQNGFEYVGSIDSEDIPPVMMFHEEDYQLDPAIRLYADEENKVVIMDSDVPISAHLNDSIGTVID